MIKDILAVMFVLLVGALLLFSFRADAQDLKAVPISEGTPAPFGGMLMTIDLATNLGVKLETCELKKKLEMEHAKKMCSVGKAQLDELFSIRERALQKKLDATSKALDEANKYRRPFWEEPALVASVGIAAGVALGFGAVWAATQLRP